MLPAGRGSRRCGSADQTGQSLSYGCETI